MKLLLDTFEAVCNTCYRNQTHRFDKYLFYLHANEHDFAATIQLFYAIEGAYQNIPFQDNLRYAVRAWTFELYPHGYYYYNEKIRRAGVLGDVPLSDLCALYEAMKYFLKHN